MGHGLQEPRGHTRADGCLGDGGTLTDAWGVGQVEAVLGVRAVSPGAKVCTRTITTCSKGLP